MRLDRGDNNYTDYVTELPLIERVRNIDPGDSDKSFTVPVGEMWHLNSIFIALTTSGTAGNRQIVVEAKNEDGNVIGRMSAGAVQAASTTRYYQYMQGTYRETAFINTDIQVPMPMDSYLKAGYSLHVYDSAIISPAADNMIVGVSYKLYKV
jgi:hypothetical protein